MKITRLKITNYRGIEALEMPIPPGGVIIKGENGAGKSSVLNAIRAALDAQDIGADAIRHGHDRAEILINLDDVKVNRILSEKGSRLSIDGADSKQIPHPAKWLATLLGGVSFDPFDLFHDKAKERRARILAALPIKVTPEQVKGWLGDEVLETEPNYKLHGLEVIEHVRKEFYGRRTLENAKVKELKGEAEALEAGAPPAEPTAIPLDKAEAALAAATTEYGNLAARHARVAQQVEKARTTRERAAGLRTRATEVLASATLAPDHGAKVSSLNTEANAQAQMMAEYTRKIAELESQLAEARVILSGHERKKSELQKELSVLFDAETTQERAAETAASMRTQADDLEALLNTMSEESPTTAEIEANAIEAGRATKEVAKSKAAKLRAEHEIKVAEARGRLSSALERAGKLDALVVKWTKEVPNEILASTDSVPGLALEGEEVILDNVVMSKLSGREQLLFAVEIARRLNTRAKILIVDGIERVDGKALPEFIAKATADGYQLIATRVENCDVMFEAIEA